jgi:hypothetical protein
MMKKLLVLMMVLGMASLANAGLILTIGGEPAPDEITLKPSDWIEIDIDVTADHTCFAYDVALQLSNAQAKLDLQMGPIGFPTEFFFAGAIIGDPTAQSVRVSASQFMSGTDVAGPAVLVNNVLLHCEEDTDVVLALVVKDGVGTVVDGQQLTTGDILDSILIHQIPEPMTMVLLGLGGLFLRRRK